MPTWLTKKNFKKSTEMNYSQCKRKVLELIGPTARVWVNESPEKPELTVQVGYDNYPGRCYLGAGKTFQEAFDIAKQKLEEAKKTK